jgi:hypothetical protein
VNPAVPPPVRVRTGGGNARDAKRSEGAWYSVYLRYWYKSTNTGEEGASGDARYTLTEATHLMTHTRSLRPQALVA